MVAASGAPGNRRQLRPIYEAFDILGVLWAVVIGFMGKVSILKFITGYDLV